MGDVSCVTAQEHASWSSSHVPGWLAAGARLTVLCSAAPPSSLPIAHPPPGPTFAPKAIPKSTPIPSADTLPPALALPNPNPLSFPGAPSCPGCRPNLGACIGLAPLQRCLQSLCMGHQTDISVKEWSTAFPAGKLAVRLGQQVGLECVSTQDLCCATDLARPWNA